jgi:hypothetical protein
MNPAIARRVVLSAFVALAAPLAEARSVSVAGSGANEVYDCAGDNASIGGSGNDVTLRNCDNVRVTGSGNTVRAYKPTSITVRGTNNRVTWTGSREPKISNLGYGNTVDEADRAGKEGAPDTVVKSGSVDGDGDVTVKSSRPDLVLKEDGNTYRFRDCGRVVINGDDNTIDAGTVDTLDVRGDGNTVSWRGAKPRVRDEGSGNTIRGR